MSDNTEPVVSTTQSSDSKDPSCSCDSEPPNKIEKMDVDIKDESCTTETPSTTPATQQDACAFDDTPSGDDKPIIDLKDAVSVEIDCKHSQSSDTVTSPTITISNKNEDGGNEIKDNANESDNKGLQVSTITKRDCELQNVKEEKTEAPVEQLDNQQTRNLFETVGLALRSNSSNPVDSHPPDCSSTETSKEKPSNSSFTNVPEVKEEGAPLYCRFCGFPAPTQTVYQDHMKYHDKTNATYTCFICGIKYKKRDFIITHYVKTHELEEANLLKCEICKFVTSDDSSFKEHNRKHFLIRPHSCGICYQTFATLYNYQRHMEKHTESERDGVGYIKPVSKRRRGSSLSQVKTDISTSHKRSRQASKSEEANKNSSENSKGGRPKSVSRKSISQDEPVESKSQEPTPEPSQEIIPTKQYYILPTRKINLVCSFCEAITLSKRELSQHLLSSHGDEIISFKSF